MPISLPLSSLNSIRVFMSLMSSNQCVGAAVELDSMVIAMEENLVFNHSPSIERQHTADGVPATQTWLQNHRTRISKLCSRTNVILLLVLTALATGLAIASYYYSNRPTPLAIWTANKDYIEFCEAHDWEPDNCAGVQDRQLPPPPTRLMVLRRWFESSGAQSNNAFSCSLQSDNHTDPSYVPDRVLGQPASQMHARSTRTNSVFSLAFCFLGLVLIAWLTLRVKRVPKQEHQETEGLSDSQIPGAKAHGKEVVVTTHVPYAELRRTSGEHVTMDLGSFDSSMRILAIDGPDGAPTTVRRRMKQPSLQPVTASKSRHAHGRKRRTATAWSNPGYLSTNEHWTERVSALSGPLMHNNGEIYGDGALPSMLAFMPQPMTYQELLVQLDAFR